MLANNASSAKKASKPTTVIDNTYSHLQPQAVDLERVVLGALMIDSDAFSAVSETLQPETFYEPRHQHIYSAIQSLSYNERPVDIMTVVEELKKQGNLESVGGEPYIVELCSRVASSAHIVYHAQILAHKFLARQLISLASSIETEAFGEMTDVDELMQMAEGKLFELSQKNLRKQYSHISTVLKEATDILKKASSYTSGLTGLPTGYRRLDKITSGWQNSDLIIVAGRPGMGKTSFALSVAKNMAVDNNIPTAFFTLEMSNTQLANRLMSNVFEIEGSKILSGQLDPDEWQRFDKNIERLRQVPLYIDETASLSIFELRTKARRLVREKGVKVIIIDYLQLMTASGMRFGNRQEEVSNISKSLKGLAKELNIPIITLSQLNREFEKREGNENKRPQLSDLRESGAIEQDADLVMFVHRPEYYKLYKDDTGEDMRGKAEIIIAKHRKGATDVVRLMFQGEYTRFEDYLGGISSPRDGGEFIGSKINTAGPQFAIPVDGDPLGEPLPEDYMP